MGVSESSNSTSSGQLTDGNTHVEAAFNPYPPLILLENLRPENALQFGIAEVGELKSIEDPAA